MEEQSLSQEQQEQKNFIHVEYSILPEDIYQAAQLNDRRRKTYKRTLIGVIILGLIGLFFLVRILMEPTVFPNYITLAMCIAGGFVIYSSPSHSNRIFAKKLSASWSSYDMTIDQNGVRIFDARNPSMERRHYHLQYADGLQIYEMRQRFIFFPAAGKMFVLPKSVLTPQQLAFAHDTMKKQAGKRFVELDK